MTKNSTTKSTKSSSTFSFLRMIDGTLLIGECGDFNPDSEYIKVINAVLLGCAETDYIEQKYYFVGMHCPFSIDKPIITMIRKSSVLSINVDLDSQLLTQYNKYVNSWFSTRDKLNTIEEDSVRSELEQKIEVLARALANNVIH